MCFKDFIGLYYDLPRLIKTVLVCCPKGWYIFIFNFIHITCYHISCLQNVLMSIRDVIFQEITRFQEVFEILPCIKEEESKFFQKNLIIPWKFSYFHGHTESRLCLCKCVSFKVHNLTLAIYIFTSYLRCCNDHHCSCYK